MDINNISPLLRYAHSLTVKNDWMYTSGLCFTAYDARLFYCTQGHGRISVCGKEYEMERGVLIVFRGGCEYKFMPESESPMQLTALNFDLYSPLYDYAVSENAPIPPCISQQFNSLSLTDKNDEFSEFSRSCPLYTKNAEAVSAKLSEILTIYSQKRLNYRGKCNSLLKFILLETAELSENSETNEKAYLLAEKIVNYITENPSLNLSNKEVAAHFGYHPYYINRIIVKYTGSPLHKYVTSRKIDKAIELLNSGEYTVSGAAYAVGIPDVCRFSKLFKRITSRTPSEYKK